MRGQTGVVVALAILALSGCAKSNRDLAIDACHKAVAERLDNKLYVLSHDTMARGFKSEDGGLAEITASVVFDQGLPAENRQTMTCRVQFDASQPEHEPNVISLVFQW